MKHLRALWPEIAIAAFVLTAAASSVLVPASNRVDLPDAVTCNAPSYPEAPLRAQALLP